MFLQNYLFRSNSCFFWFLLISFFTTIKTVFNSTAYIKNRLDITGFVRVIGYVVEIILYLVIFKLFSTAGMVCWNSHAGGNSH